jgi:hypothetical protein
MIFGKINLIVPTYNRSNTRLPQFISSFIGTAADVTRIHFTFVVNEDDRDTIDLLRDYPRAQIKMVVLPPSDKPHLAALMNAGFDQTPFKGDAWVYGYAGDDFVSRTDGWDAHVLSAVNRSKGMKCIWGFDDYLNDLPTYYFMPDRLFRALDTPYWVYPHAGMELTDLITRDMLAPFGRLHHCPDLHLEHMHASRTDVGHDNTFARLQGADNSRATAQDVKEYILKCQSNLKSYMRAHQSCPSSSAPSKSALIS